MKVWLLHYAHVLVALSISAWLVAEHASWSDRHRMQTTDLEDAFAWRAIAVYLVVATAFYLPVYSFLGWMFKKF